MASGNGSEPRLGGDPSPLVSCDDNSPFELRLAQAIAWCGALADLAQPQTSLRSPDLLQLSVFPISRASTVNQVLSRRGWHETIRPVRPTLPRDGLAGGRLLAYLPEEQLSDGAAELETHGFFDEDNVPPCDTWVGLFANGAEYRSYASDVLISWVPAEFVALAEQGINVNPEECIKWLADSDVPVAAEIRARGFLPK